MSSARLFAGTAPSETWWDLGIDDATNHTNDRASRFASTTSRHSLGRSVLGCSVAGLIIERVGRNDTVLKVLPPLTITADELDEGLGIIEGALKRCLDGLLVG